MQIYIGKTLYMSMCACVCVKIVLLHGTNERYVTYNSYFVSFFFDCLIEGGRSHKEEVCGRKEKLSPIYY